MDFLFDKDNYRRYLVIKCLFENKFERVMKQDLSNQVLGCSKTIMTTVNAIVTQHADYKSRYFEIEINYKWVRGKFSPKFNLGKLKEFYLQDSVLVKMLNHIYKHNQINIVNYAEKNYYSEKTIRSKINRLNKELKKYNLILEGAQVIKLVGKEEDIHWFYVHFFRYITNENWIVLSEESNNIMKTLLSVSYLGRKLIKPLEYDLLWDLNYLIRIMKQRNDVTKRLMIDETFLKKIYYRDHLSDFSVSNTNKYWILFILLSNTNLEYHEGLYCDYNHLVGTINQAIIDKLNRIIRNLEGMCEENNLILNRKKIVKGRLLQIMVNDHYCFQSKTCEKYYGCEYIKMSKYHFLKILNDRQDDNKKNCFSSTSELKIHSLLINHLAMKESYKYSILLDMGYSAEGNELIVNKVLNLELSRYYKIYRHSEKVPDVVVTNKERRYNQTINTLYLVNQGDSDIVFKITEYLSIHLKNKKGTIFT